MDIGPRYCPTCATSTAVLAVRRSSQHIESNTLLWIVLQGLTFRAGKLIFLVQIDNKTIDLVQDVVKLCLCWHHPLLNVPNFNRSTLIKPTIRLARLSYIPIGPFSKWRFALRQKLMMFAKTFVVLSKILCD